MSATLEFLNFVKAEWTERPGGLIAPASYTPKSGETTDEEWWDRAGKMQIEEEEARDERKAKYQEAKTKPGFLGRHLGYLTETGLESAAKQRAEGTAGQSQGTVQSSPSGMGTGKASAFARQKGGQAPRLQGKVPSLSTKVRMTKPPKMAMPQVPGMKMEKDNSDFHTWPAYQQWAERTKARGLDPMTTTMVDLHPDDVVTPEQHAETLNKIKVDMQNKFPDVYGESSVSKLLKAVDDGYNTKGERREAKRRKDRKMKVTGTGVRTLQQIMIDRANKLKGQEGTE